MTKAHISLISDACLMIFIAGKKPDICGNEVRFWDSIFLLGQIVNVVNKIFTDVLVFFSTFV